MMDITPWRPVARTVRDPESTEQALRVLRRTMAMRGSIVLSWALAAALWTACVPSLWAAPPADSLLPETTRGFVSVPDLDVLDRHFSQTQLGQLADDPAMKSFADNLKRQFDEKLARSYERLGLQWEDIRAMAAGEVAVATVDDHKAPAAMAVIMDIQGREEAAAERLQQVFDRLLAEKFQRRTAQEQQTLLEVFELPADEKAKLPARQAVYFLKDDLLCCADQLALARELLARFVAGPRTSLATSESYRYVMDRCQQDAGEIQPDLRWFIEPLAYAAAVRSETSAPQGARAAEAAPGDRGGGNPRPGNQGANGVSNHQAAPPDPLEVMRRQGFEALRGAGGWVQFFPHEGKYEILHRTAIYAPQPYELAMRMVKLPNVPSFEPPPWANRKLARWTALNLDVGNAFEMASTLFDEVFGAGEEGAFEGMLKGVKKDVNGPQVDLREDVVANLGTRVTILVDYHAPGLNDSGERRVFAIEAANPVPLSTAIDKLLAADKSARKTNVGETTVWEISENPSSTGPAPPKVKVPVFGNRRRSNPGAAKHPQDGANVKLLQRSAVAVAHGHLFIATHIDALKEVLEGAVDSDQMQQDAEFQRVMQELNALAPGEQCARVFTRTKEARRLSYELFKQGKLRQSDTLLSRIINGILGEKPSANKPQEVEGADLPEFSQVERYFGPAGTAFKSEEHGWFAVGVLLKHEQDLVTAETLRK